MKPHITKEELKTLLKYHKTTGKFVWLDDRSRGMLQMVAGTLHPSGYIHIGIMGRYYKAHRLAWLYCFGEIPTGMCIDHMNGKKEDNRLCNLRCVTLSENMHNQRKPHAGNTSGFLGVCWDTEAQKFRAQIQIEGKMCRLGRFDSAKEAYKVYLKAKREGHGGCLI